jgi:FKBP-type peptidyl-prolyl cis-trans isomerase
MTSVSILRGAALLGASLFLVACGKQADDTAQAPEPAPAVPEVTTTTTTTTASPAGAETLEARLAALPLASATDQASYGLGYNVGMNFSQRGVPELDAESLLAGILDALEGRDPRLDGEVVSAAFNTLQTRANAALAQAAEANLVEAKAWLAENATRPGVRTTSSGLQYEVIMEGDGARPSATSTVEVHYHGTLTNGTVFDSSVQRGETIKFGLNQVISGWTEGLQLMRVGGKYRFFIPPQLAYGPQDKGTIPPNSALIFEVELFAVE